MGSLLGESGRPIVDPRQEETSTSGQGSQQRYTHFLCISPDAPSNPVLYWLGNFDPVTTRFLLDKAKGSLRLDLGDILYAPNLMVDDKVRFLSSSLLMITTPVCIISLLSHRACHHLHAHCYLAGCLCQRQKEEWRIDKVERYLQGRHVLWGWLQERRKVGSYDYAGCMSLPRLIYIRGDRLIQEPVPEVAALRSSSPWQADNLTIFPEESLPLEGISGPAIEIQATFERSALYSESRLYTSSQYYQPVQQSKLVWLPPLQARDVVHVLKGMSLVWQQIRVNVSGV